MQSKKSLPQGGVLAALLVAFVAFSTVACDEPTAQVVEAPTPVDTGAVNDGKIDAIDGLDNDGSGSTDTIPIVDEVPTETTDPCEKLYGYDGVWTDPDTGLTAYVVCDFMDTSCSFTMGGEASLFNDVTFVGTDLPLSKPIEDTTYDGEYELTIEVDALPDGSMVQREYVDGELNTEKILRR